MSQNRKARVHAMNEPLIFDPKGGMPRLLMIMERLRDPDTG
ncbi:MAG: nucleoside triphosphate pyrophosphohydrolase, partial [Paracoccaceae bacterium]|nr:nucleoside triphosphate pyrophosphohydrolase [Paracoccaceae bacterium]